MDNDTMALIAFILGVFFAMCLIAWNEGRKSKNRLIDKKNVLKPDIKTCDAEVWRKSIEDEK